MEQKTIYRIMPGNVETTDAHLAHILETVLSVLLRPQPCPACGFLPADAADVPPASPLAADVQAIQTAMQTQGLSGRGLAKKAGVSPGTVSAFLKGKPVADRTHAKIVQGVRLLGERLTYELH